jgi:hypothetical protein
MTRHTTALWVHRIAWGLLTAMLWGCTPFNQGIDQDFSNQSMVCKDGIKYLPFTNGRDQAYTSEGRPETCPRDL